ncbi:MAG: ATP-dependent DNA ligase [Candidatus Babeliales bacterium]
MQFKKVAEQFEKIEAENSRIEMTKLLAELFLQTTDKEIGIICNLSLGLLRPPYQGTQFNLAEKSLIKVLADLLSLPIKEVTQDARKFGDLGIVITEHATYQPEKYLTVLQVYDELCAIEAIGGEGSQEAKATRTLQLLKQVEPLSAKFIVRIILGTLRLGFSEMTIIDALSWMEVGNKTLRKRIEHAYNICVDIGLIASTLKAEGIEALDKMKIHVGIPIRPAAAERMPTAQDIFKKLGNCVAQPKLDGFRIQIHIDKTTIKPRVEFFSRHLIDMSHMFPDLVEALLDLNIQTMIAEGEAIAYEPNTGTFLPFQETVKRKRKHGIEQAISEFPLRVYLFDLLYLDGQQYLDQTHEDRRQKLLGVMQGYKGDKVQVIGEVVINSAKELEEYFNKQMDIGLEGIVVKKPDAIYQPGKRNFNWIKFKRQEEGHLEDTLDCVILGYYAGSGKRATFGIGAFLVGVYNKNEDHFETVAKIGTGLTDEGWKELKKKCDAIKTDEKPKNVVSAKELYPDTWVYPELVCMIRADEITLSPLHTAGKTKEKLGYALRFPRFMGYRPDKGPEESTTIAELKRLYEDQFKMK